MRWTSARPSDRTARPSGPGTSLAGTVDDWANATRQDTAFVRLTFRDLVQRVVVLMAALYLLHAVMFYMAGDGIWPWVAATALAGIPMRWMTARARPFPIFLAGVALVLVMAITYVAVLSSRFGEEAGFHFLLLVMVPVIMVSGRISIFTKWLMVVGLAVYLLSLDHSFQMLWRQVGTPASLQQRAMHVVNVVMVLTLLAMVTLHYFLVVVRMQSQLATLASTDPLTGLNNRRRFTEAAEHELAQSRRHQLPVSVVLCDLDHFKAINDRWGHDGGDAVLRHASQVIRQVARETDTVCRWGGEEFLMLLPNTDLAGAVHLAERVRQLMADTPAPVARQAVHVTLTLGAATLAPGETLDAVIARADAALYAGKSAGRNRVTPSGDVDRAHGDKQT
jgi:diguanylate cyclase (GGDEF)-like protein